jgi:hypothetical protein
MAPNGFGLAGFLKMRTCFWIRQALRYYPED